jgi:hypothetical protein
VLALVKCGMGMSDRTSTAAWDRVIVGKVTMRDDTVGADCLAGRSDGGGGGADSRTYVGDTRISPLDTSGVHGNTAWVSPAVPRL